MKTAYFAPLKAALKQILSPTFGYRQFELSLLKSLPALNFFQKSASQLFRGEGIQEALNERAGNEIITFELGSCYTGELRSSRSGHIPPE